MYAFGSAEKGQLGNGDTGERLATGQRVVFGIETVPRMHSTYPPSHKSDADRARSVTLPVTHSLSILVLIKELANRTIVDVSAGQQHCIAIDDAGCVPRGLLDCV